jgi:hypothetical protein|tara:strand:+ start:219 stop:338 length:120 start_codon:yes stop_codon:yes gene_type:complete
MLEKIKKSKGKKRVLKKPVKTGFFKININQTKCDLNKNS